MVSCISNLLFHSHTPMHNLHNKWINFESLHLSRVKGIGTDNSQEVKSNYTLPLSPKYPLAFPFLCSQWSNGFSSQPFLRLYCSCSSFASQFKYYSIQFCLLHYWNICIVLPILDWQLNKCTFLHLKNKAAIKLVKFRDCRSDYHVNDSNLTLVILFHIWGVTTIWLQSASQANPI